MTNSRACPTIGRFIVQAQRTGVVIVIVAAGSRRRARIRMTSAEWTPSLSAVAQAVSTAGRPSLSTGQDIDHLPVAALHSRELPTRPVQCGQKDPILEGCAEYRRAFDFLRFGASELSFVSGDVTRRKTGVS
ncbi:hypothetical protein LMTR3_12325 [Bradyrhizobium sp. LMTR 3]|nr:hypothetical protein LMTR3_12325 [Bradyrhizobium sp. LMTR 3]